MVKTKSCVVLFHMGMNVVSPNFQVKSVTFYLKKQKLSILLWHFEYMQIYLWFQEFMPMLRTIKNSLIKWCQRKFYPNMILLYHSTAEIITKKSIWMNPTAAPKYPLLQCLRWHLREFWQYIYFECFLIWIAFL